MLNIIFIYSFIFAYLFEINAVLFLYVLFSNKNTINILKKFEKSCRQNTRVSLKINVKLVRIR